MTEPASLDDVVRMSRWTTTIGAVCEKFAGGIQTGPFGSQLHASDYSDDGTPVVMPQDMQGGQVVLDRIARVSQRHVDRLHRHTLRAGDIVFSRRGDVSRFAVITNREQGWLCGTGSIRIRLNSPDIDIDYVRRYLQQDVVAKWLEHHAKGVTMPNLNTAVIRALPFVYPPLPEQRRIAAVLDRADELRAKRWETVKCLKGLTQAMFMEMFGDPATNPRAWPVEPVGRHIKSVRYGTGSPPTYVDAGVAFIRATNIKEGRIDVTDIRRISAASASDISKCRVAAGDLIVVRSGVNTGDCAVVPASLDGAYAAYDLIVEADSATAHYFSAIMNSRFGARLLARLTRRAAQAHLNSEQLTGLMFPVPPKPLREQFVHVLASIEHQRTTLLTAVVEQDALFESLQHQAFSGAL